MSFRVGVFAWRKSGTSPVEFKQYYDNVHLPLVKSLVGDKFPITHTRHYVQRTPTEGAATDKSNAAHPPVTFVGKPEDFSFDCFAELVFEDVTAFQGFMAAVTAPGTAEKIQADEERFLDRSKLLAASIDDISVLAR